MPWGPNSKNSNRPYPRSAVGQSVYADYGWGRLWGVVIRAVLCWGSQAHPNLRNTIDAKSDESNYMTCYKTIAESNSFIVLGQRKLSERARSV
jgi:hypothetical protein